MLNTHVFVAKLTVDVVKQFRDLDYLPTALCVYGESGACQILVIAPEGRENMRRDLYTLRGRIGETPAQTARVYVEQLKRELLRELEKGADLWLSVHDGTAIVTEGKEAAECMYAVQRYMMCPEYPTWSGMIGTAPAGRIWAFPSADLL